MTKIVNLNEKSKKAPPIQYITECVYIVGVAEQFGFNLSTIQANNIWRTYSKLLNEHLEWYHLNNYIQPNLVIHGVKTVLNKPISDQEHLNAAFDRFNVIPGSCERIVSVVAEELNILLTMEEAEKIWRNFSAEDNVAWKFLTEYSDDQIITAIKSFISYWVPTKP